MCTAMHVFMIALMVQSGLAIKCFNCVSEMDKECDKMNDQSLTTQECDDEKQAELERQFQNKDRHFLLRISDIYYHRPPNSKTDSVAMVCQKLVGTDDKENRMVVRRCQLANVQCNDSYALLATQFPSEYKVEVCEICKDKDGCNGSSSYRGCGVVFGIAVVIVNVCRYLGL